ncbi:2Fe-2S iron-sulfur cluster-binding protein [Novosphingobium resinovorum]|uniref:2Fe-2S iron-sulfur cluster-binding protein n=1 Tax=Novosphingobium resinovorum TaxID=158500 RepID=UPI002ED522F2|nr:2Fe-2S iron-sulfur cluster-binding protein [Novosphingobium resinovorum]
MVQLTIVGREGAETHIEADAGLTLMEAIREAGFDELQAMCGGSCSCATCHVFLEEGFDAFPAADEDEDDLLDSSDYRRANSRLSCQVALAKAQGALRVVIAPED